MSVEPTSDVKVDVLAGHLGHLTEAQQEAFVSFRKNLAEAQLYVPAGEGSTEHASHDEPTLLYVPNSLYVYECQPTCRRFLRARRFDPKKAQKQFADAEAWRTKHNVDELFATFPVDEFEASRRFYPRWTGRRDKVRGYMPYDLRSLHLTASLEWSSSICVSNRIIG